MLLMSAIALPVHFQYEKELFKRISVRYDGMILVCINHTRWPDPGDHQLFSTTS